MFWISKKDFDRIYEQAKIDKVDIHTAVAAEYFGVPVDKVTRKQRNEAKQANFIHLYTY